MSCGCTLRLASQPVRPHSPPAASRPLQGCFPNCRLSQMCQMDRAGRNTRQNIKAAASGGLAAPHGSFSHQILAVAASWRVRHVSDRKKTSQSSTVRSDCKRAAVLASNQSDSPYLSTANWMLAWINALLPNTASEHSFPTR